MKLYPYIPNVGAVRKHFIDMAEGKEQIGYGAKGKLSSSSTTSRELLSQFSTCSE